MELTILAALIDLFLHLDKYLEILIQNYGLYVYALLFLIIFLETGFVITPFLPGDSLLFAAGTFAGINRLSVMWLFILLAAAAIIGDTANYWIGHFIGPKVFRGNRFFKREYLHKTERFYAKHGGKTIIIARFIPIIRTFAPFIAGIGSMKYPRFLSYNIIGGILWVGLFIFGGFFFGHAPLVKNNFSLVILMIILISIMPGVIEYIREKRKNQYPK